MKRLNRKVPSLAGLLGIFVLLWNGNVHAQSTIDFSNNGSFADYDLGVISGNDNDWVYNMTETVLMEIVEDAQDGDDRALKISFGAFNDGDDWNIEAVNENLLVRAGDTYTASVWIKADSVARDARFYFGLPAAGDWARFNQTDVDLDTVWTKYELEYTATPTDESIGMRFGIPLNFSSNVDGEVYIDNLSVIGPNPDGSQNTNGSFEDSEVTERADTLEVDGWTFELQDIGDANFAIVDDEVKDGNRALRIDINTPGDNDWSIQAINETFPVESGIIYTFSAWAKASANGASANFTTGNPSFAEFGRLDKSSVSLTTEWQEFSFDFQVGEDDSVGRAPIHVSMAENAGLSIWLDSVRIQKPIIPDEVFEPIARDKPKFLGNIYSSSQSVRFTEYWNQVTPENAGKWGSVESTRDVMNWTDLDAAYALAKDNGFPFRFHVLVWGNQQPSWMKNLSQEEQLEEIEEWMQAVADRYPDIDYLEVVNEPLHDPPTDDPNDSGSGGYYEALGGAGDTGWDWIITAFEMADSIFADSVKLMINDYNILGSSSNTNKYLEIVDLLKERDLIDAIGAQGHNFSTKYVNSSVINSNLNSLGNSGLPVQITELDINGSTTNNSEAAQLAEYERVFPTIWEHESVIGVTLWGWRPGMWVEDALLISASEQERTAMEWLREYVETTEVTVVSNEEESSNETPNQFLLQQNYPNPFNPTTQITYQLPVNTNVRLRVYDITGRLVATLIDGRQNAGTHTMMFDASGLSSGIYLYELRTSEFRSVQKMMLIK